ncbi:MAG: DMT family transporter [Clostridia bacterium]|nr:DMT family transporter [Clostridia bacterium]
MNTEAEEKTVKKTQKRALAYCGIVFVILIWGIYPIIADDLLGFYSGGAFSFAGTLISALALTLICLPKLGRLDLSYFRVAVPTGFFVGLANLLQKIGLRSTTPTLYAFLENLSCVAVPLLLFLLIRKKPSFLTVAAGVICLAGCFILSGAGSAGGFSFGAGEILCALAGILYGVNIAATGVFAKKLDALLYVMLQMWTQAAVSGAALIALDRITVGGSPIEKAVFSFSPVHLLALAGLALAISTLGWIIRTEALKYVDAAAVAVLMPFSSVVTGVIAVIAGKDVFSPALLIGGLVILAASILSGIADARDGNG